MFQPELMHGKRVLVTGGGTGLGRAMTERFLQLGAQVVICGRRKRVVDTTAAELMRANGGAVQAFGLDIRDAAAVDAMVEEIFAAGPLTGLVNNAASNFISPTEALSPRGFDAIANIVMHGTFYVTHAGQRPLLQRHSHCWKARACPRHSPAIPKLRVSWRCGPAIWPTPERTTKKRCPSIDELASNGRCFECWVTSPT